MSKKLKVMSLVLSVLFLVAFFFWKDSSEEGFSEKNQVQQEEIQIPVNEIKVESHAREEQLSEEALNDFEPNFGDDIREVTQEEGQSDPSFQDFDALEQLFEEVEQEWRSSMERLVRQDLGLKEEVLGRYYELRDDYDEAKLMAFEDYHQKMIDQHGDDYAFNPSLQMENFDNDILPRYQEELEKLIGREGVRKYIQMKDEFNQKIRKKGHPGAALILIDF